MRINVVAVWPRVYKNLGDGLAKVISLERALIMLKGHNALLQEAIVSDKAHHNTKYLGDGCGSIKDEAHGPKG
jgi:hypothetical protein